MSAKQTVRGIFDFLDNNPAVEAGLELLLIALATFLPFLFAALFSMFTTQTFHVDTWTGGFLSYFARGELATAVFALCGSAAWLLVSRTFTLSKITRTIILVGLLLPLVISVGMIAQNPGFRFYPPDWVLLLLLGMYVLTASVWWWLAVITRTKNPPHSNSAAAASRIVMEARRNEAG